MADKSSDFRKGFWH